MDRQRTGSQIAADLGDGRPFWQMRASSIASWADTLPHSATMSFANGVEWVGVDWDGASSVEIGDPYAGSPELVTAPDIHALIKKLRRGMPVAIRGPHRLPTSASVRTCIAPSGMQALTIDLDLIDFILPVCIDFRGAFVGQKKPTIAVIADRMLGLAQAAEARREAMAAREARMRRALEETSARIGDGAAPLWLRLEPIAHHEDPKYVPHSGYVMLLAILDENLLWSPIGSRSIHTVKDVRSHHGHYYRDHRRRAATLRRMLAEATDGYVDEVAFALLIERGLDPQRTLRSARDAAFEDRASGLKFARGGRSETLFLRDGVLWASFDFEGGCFAADELSIWGTHPETLAHAAAGRPLSDFVAHPLLIASTARADHGRIRPGALDVTTEKRPISVREAQKRFEAAMQAPVPRSGWA